MTFKSASDGTRTMLQYGISKLFESKADRFLCKLIACFQKQPLCVPHRNQVSFCIQKYCVPANYLVVTTTVNGKGIGLFPLVKSPTLTRTLCHVGKHFSEALSETV